MLLPDFITSHLIACIPIDTPISHLISSSLPSLHSVILCLLAWMLMIKDSSNSSAKCVYDKLVFDPFAGALQSPVSRILLGRAACCTHKNTFYVCRICSCFCYALVVYTWNTMLYLQSGGLARPLLYSEKIQSSSQSRRR